MAYCEKVVFHCIVVLFKIEEVHFLQLLSGNVITCFWPWRCVKTHGNLKSAHPKVWVDGKTVQMEE